MGARTTGDLIRAAAAGAQDAWDEIVQRYGGLVWAVVRSHRLDPADAADVFQTTWLRLVEQVHKIRDPDRLGGWLATTARRECLRLLRSRQREIPDEEIAGPGSDPAAADETSPETLLLTQETRAELELAFARLPARCQDLLRILVATPELSYTDISRALDIPVGSIGPTRGRCLQHLRRLLTETHRPVSGATP